MDVVYREETDRWIRGDRHVRPLVRKLLPRQPGHRSGMQIVVQNFLLGLARLKIEFRFNSRSLVLRRKEPVITFGLAERGLRGISRRRPIIAAIGFPYPTELPSLCEEYDVRKFLQHSPWVLDLVRSAGLYPDHIFDLWPAGIDTEEWRPSGAPKRTDALIYSKMHWDRESHEARLVAPIRDYLSTNRYSYEELAYGNYSREEYKEALSRCKVMIFLSAHESQGLAYQECLSSGVPVIAWDPGEWLDPIRFRYGRPSVAACSVPYFDSRCGVVFRDLAGFMESFPPFFDNCNSGMLRPREFIQENLTIEISTRRMLDIYNSL